MLFLGGVFLEKKKGEFLNVFFFGFRWFHNKTLPTNRDLLPFISFYDIFFVVVCLEPLFSVTPHA